MAGYVHRCPVTWVAVLGILLSIFSLGTARAVGGPTSCALVSQPIIRGKVPILFVHGINSGPDAWTTGKVTGTSESPLDYIVNSIGKDKVAGYTFDWSKWAGHMNRDTGTRDPLMWVSNPGSINPGQDLSQAISCLARGSDHKVIIVAHSMGGLLAQDASSRVSQDIEAMFTLGTPHSGSWMANLANGKGQFALGGFGTFLASAIRTLCWRYWQDKGPWCDLIAERHDPGVLAMLEDPGVKSGWKALNPWPSNFPKYSLADEITDTWEPIWPLKLQLSTDSFGDGVVSTSSQRAKWDGKTYPCPGNNFIGLDALGKVQEHQCFHSNEPRNKALLDYIIMKARPLLPTATTGPGIGGKESSTQTSWYDRSYKITCDDMVQTPTSVVIHGGTGTATGSGIDSGHERWDVRIQQVTHGDLPSPLGNVTGVLFYCSPQPSNYFLQELRVYRTGNGSEVGRIPALQSDREGGSLPPVYTPGSVAIKNGQVSADVKFYGPNDSHAGGPSILRHLSWVWNGQEFAESQSPSMTISVCTSIVNCSSKSYMKSEPTQIVTSADGAVYVKDITWSGWGNDTATGTGTLELNNCNPNCATGTSTGYPATVTLSRLVTYDSGARAYSKMVVNAPTAGYSYTFSGGLVP